MARTPKRARRRPAPLGARLRALRHAAGLTLAGVAGPAGVTVPYLSQLETGVRTRPSLAVLRRLAKALGVPLMRLLE
jgi:transcriptional regulator with XRE-family HTH domain